MFKIGGATVHAPRKVTILVQDLSSSDSGRNADGTAMIDFVAAKRKIEVEWPAMNTADMKSVMQAMSAVTFEVTYIDPETGTENTITCYKGDRTVPVYWIIDGEVLWESLKVNFVEV